jgi:flagellar motor switch protein FliG
VADLIKNEHPQIIATILVHLEHDHASEILNHFTERLRNDVVLRIATLEGIQPAALKELNDAMLRILSGSTSIKRTAMGGVRTVAEILNFIGTANETSVVDAIREYDPDLAQKILDEMFVFENLMDIDDRSIQLILREVQSDSLILALKGALARIAREDLQEHVPARRRNAARRPRIEGAGAPLGSRGRTKGNPQVVRRLADEGQIVLGGAGGEQMV